MFAKQSDIAKIRCDFPCQETSHVNNTLKPTFFTARGLFFSPEELFKQVPGPPPGLGRPLLHDNYAYGPGAPPPVRGADFFPNASSCFFLLPFFFRCLFALMEPTAPDTAQLSSTTEALTRGGAIINSRSVGGFTPSAFSLGCVSATPDEIHTRES